MLRYTKTLSLALLFSLPAFAMENTDDQALVSASQEETVANELTRTLIYGQSLDRTQAELLQLAEEKKALEEKEAKARDAKKLALAGLEAKKIAHEEAISGAKTGATTIAAQLLALTQERDQKPKDIMENAKKEVDAYNLEAEKKAEALKKQQEALAASKTEHEEALKTIKAKIEKANKQDAAPKTTGRWYLLGW